MVETVRFAITARITDGKNHVRSSQLQGSAATPAPRDAFLGRMLRLLFRLNFLP